MLDKFALSTDASSSAESRMNQLETNQERLFLLCTTLAELLRDKGLATEGEILDKLKEVDMRDGLADGKFGGIQLVVCAQCGNKTKLRHKHCIYCGSLLIDAVPLA